MSSAPPVQCSPFPVAPRLMMREKGVFRTFGGRCCAATFSCPRSHHVHRTVQGVRARRGRLDLDTRYYEATKFSLPMYFGIGLAQCLSMIPGVSRSGATIVAAMLLGADRRSAAEFSFWLAMPTMAGAFAYDLLKSRGQLSMDNSILVAFGFAVSFVCAWIVVKTFLDYVQHHGFAVFAWWRVVVGALGLVALAVGY